MSRAVTATGAPSLRLAVASAANSATYITAVWHCKSQAVQWQCSGDVLAYSCSGDYPQGLQL